jgi:hypothetical protein
MALTTEETVTYTARLLDAENQLHKLLTNQAARVFVDQNGERVEFQATSPDKLRAYILELRVKLGKQVVSGPMKAWMM